MSDQPVYQLDENGIPIKPGYRPPFKKGFDPRRRFGLSYRSSVVKKKRNP